MQAASREVGEGAEGRETGSMTWGTRTAAYGRPLGTN